MSLLYSCGFVAKSVESLRLTFYQKIKTWNMTSQVTSPIQSSLQNQKVVTYLLIDVNDGSSWIFSAIFWPVFSLLSSEYVICSEAETISSVNSAAASYLTVSVEWWDIWSPLHLTCHDWLLYPCQSMWNIHRTFDQQASMETRNCHLPTCCQTEYRPVYTN